MPKYRKFSPEYRDKAVLTSILHALGVDRCCGWGLPAGGDFVIGV
jgi:hypothetical protein